MSPDFQQLLDTLDTKNTTADHQKMMEQERLQHEKDFAVLRVSIKDVANVVANTITSVSKKTSKSEITNLINYSKSLEGLSSKLDEIGKSITGFTINGEINLLASKLDDIKSTLIDLSANEIETQDDTQVLSAIDSIKTELMSLTNILNDYVVYEKNDTSDEDLLKTIKDFVKLWKLEQAKDIDEVTPIVNAITQSSADIINAINTEDVVEESKIDLSDYRVADSAEPVTGYQYFGFVSIDGAWYIMYNDAIEGKIRYKFGNSKYDIAWTEYANHDYKLLNEAINEITA